ncbi:MAG: plasma-membrane proton-efflux P-type ATPase [Candidatus Micrarchaeaceae archaeon]
MIQNGIDAEKESVKETLTRLKTSRGGLAEAESAKRLKTYGYNEIIEKKQSNVLKFLKKFYGPIPFMLELVIVITFVIHDLKDCYLILSLLLFNAVVGFLEESRAGNAIELLKKRLTVSARVLRENNWRVINARELVPGDIIRIRIGDIVPADAKIIEESRLEVDQSALTGESLPVKKGPNKIAYASSVVKEGEATCVIIATGYGTYYGRTAKLVQIAGVKSHLETIILKIARYLIAFDSIIAILLFAIGTLILHEPYAVMIPFVLLIVMASVPVALPAAFTVAMALGTKRLTEKNTLITKLESIEELSTLDTVCFDKTGTLTENKMEVKEVFAVNGHTEKEVITAAFLASRKEDNDPIDSAIIKYASETGIKTETYAVKEFTPFQPKSKMSSATVIYKGRLFRAMKGAFGVIAKESNANEKIKSQIGNKIDEYSRLNYRTIAVAAGSKKLNMIGVIALYDKPRSSAKELVKELLSLGIDIKMLTGDNLQIAQEIAKEVGIDKSITDFSELKSRSADIINKEIEEHGGFAEIFPEDKYIIVKALQKSGHRVGMTGDGVNDAPALKQAEVGIAVKNATDVAKSVAGVVLIKNGLNVIIDAIKESRRIFERMVTYAMAKIVKVIQIILFILVAFLLLRQIPILPFELILLIFTNDIANISISTDNAEYSKRPDTWNIKSMSYSSLELGGILLLLSLLFIPVGKYLEPALGAFQTFVFFMFVVTDQLLIESLRNRRSIFSTKPSKWLAITSAISVLVGALFSYFGIFITPISLVSILVIMAMSFALILVFDFAKTRIYKGIGIGKHYSISAGK